MSVVVYGLINSCIFLLWAFGFTFAYGVTRIPNFAHGALYILCGVSTWVFVRSLGLSYPISIILALLIVGAVGAAMYRFIIMRIRGMEIPVILVTYAFSLILLEGLRYGGVTGAKFSLPPVQKGIIYIAGVPVDFQRIIIIGIAGVVLLALWFFTHHTKVGLALRAIAQDERAALSLGINSNTVATIALALSAILAGVAALAVLPLSGISVHLGYTVLIYSLGVCILGGLGSWGGAVIAALLFGFAQTLTAAYLKPEFATVAVYTLIIITLIVKPSGLMGKQKELEERV